MFRLIGSPGAWRFIRKQSASGRRLPRQGDAGFTLLEVLVAFAILAIMLVPILQVFGGGLGVTGTARGYAEGALLARSKLAELTAGKLMEGDSSGSFEERGYRWRASVTADDSDVTLPDNSLVGMPEQLGRNERRSRNGPAASESRSGFGEGKGATGSSQRRPLFGQSRSGFGQSGTGFGQSGSGFGQSGSLFGQTRSGFSQGRSGEASRPASSPSGFGRTGSSSQPGLGGGEEEDGEETQVIPYRVAVTVEWGDSNSAGGTVTLTTLRLVQPNASPEPGPEPGAEPESDVR